MAKRIEFTPQGQRVVTYESQVEKIEKLTTNTAKINAIIKYLKGEDL